MALAEASLSAPGNNLRGSTVIGVPKRRWAELFGMFIYTGNPDVRSSESWSLITVDSAERRVRYKVYKNKVASVPPATANRELGDTGLRGGKASSIICTSPTLPTLASWSCWSCSLISMKSLRLVSTSSSRMPSSRCVFGALRIPPRTSPILSFSTSIAFCNRFGVGWFTV